MTNSHELRPLPTRPEPIPLDRLRRARVGDRLEDPIGKGSPFPIHDGGPGVLDVPIDLHTGGFDHPTGRGRDLGPDAVSGDQRDPMPHPARLTSGEVRVGFDQEAFLRLTARRSWALFMPERPLIPSCLASL